MIELKKIKLDGWLSYDNVEVELNKPGVTFIRGPIGSGKSAILEAIQYLLTGKPIRNKESIKDFENQVLNRGYQISLELSQEDVPYVITETRGRKGSGLSFFKGGEDVSAKTSAETRKTINEELRIDHEELRSLFSIGQRQTQVLINGTPNDRSKLLIKLFSLDKYDEAIKKVDLRLKKCKEDDKELENVVSNSEEDIKSYRESLVDVGEIEPVDLSRINESIYGIESKIEKAQSKKTTYVTKVALENKARENKVRYKNLLERLERVNVEISGIKRPKYELDFLKNKDKILNTKLAEMSYEKRDQEGKLKKAEEVSNTCPITEKKCPVDVPMEYAENIIDRCEHNIQKLQENREKLQEKGQKIANMINKLEDLESLEAEKVALQSQIESLNPEEVTTDTKPKLLKIDEKIKDLKEQKYNMLKIKSTMEEKQNAHRVAIQTNEKINAVILKAETKIKESRKAMKESKFQIKYLSLALETFKRLKRYKVDQVLSSLNDNLKEILEEISDGDYTATMVSQKEDSKGKRKIDRLGIMVSDGSKTIPIGMVSGGQETEVGLALLLSTWKTANMLSDKRMNILFLDEAFGTLDEHVINNVFKAVSKVASEIGTTSIKVISHRDINPKLFDHVWELDVDNGITIFSSY